MGGNGLLLGLIWAVGITVPLWKLLPRYGMSKYFAPIAILPAFALVLLWIIAFKDEVEGEGGS